MDYESAINIYRQIKASSQSSLRDDLIESAVRYARTRVDWWLADTEIRRAMEADRTRSHDAFIATCDILARNMSRAGEDASWRESLGSDRKVIGDFACHLHCILGISAR